MPQPPPTAAPAAPPAPQQPVPSQTFVVRVIPVTPAPENTVLKMVAGSMGIAGVLILLALVLGVAVAGVRVVWQKRHPPTDDHLPPVV